MKKRLKRLLIILAIVSRVMTSVGCNQVQNNQIAVVETQAEEFKTVQYQYLDGTSTYEVIVNSSRIRVMTPSQFMTEMLLVLGLEN